MDKLKLLQRTDVVLVILPRLSEAGPLYFVRALRIIHCRNLGRDHHFCPRAFHTGLPIFKNEFCSPQLYCSDFSFVEFRLIKYSFNVSLRDDIIMSILNAVLENIFKC